MQRLLLTLALFVGSAGVAAAAIVPTRIASDPFGLEVAGRHSTIAEPDSLSFGETVVTAFQVGRFATGGAAAIGFSTSTDGGRTWRNGILPFLSRWAQPAGAYDRVTDPVVGYDRVHGVWLVSVLALRDARGAVGTSAILTIRSRDGLTWTEQPAVVAPDIGSFIHDKNWIVCDNGFASPYAGRCYTFWMDVPSELIVASTSIDGGLTWGAPVAAPRANGNGAMPVVQPNGAVVVPFLVHEGAIASFRSVDGGATFSEPVQIAPATRSPTYGVRAPALPSAEVAADGRIFVAWHSCNDLPGCSDVAAKRVTQGILLSTTTDGVTWTPPRRIPLGPRQAALRVLPGLGVDATTAGATTRLAVVYYEIGPFPCLLGCTVSARVVTSGNAGDAWSEPVTVSPRSMDLQWIPETSGGRLLGDYLSTSFVGGGVAVPVFTAALPPQGEFLQQAVYAARVPQLAPARLRITAGPATVTRARAAARFGVSFAVARTDGESSLPGARVTCTARIGGARLAVLGARVRAGRVNCVWRIPPRTSGRRVAWTVRVALGSATAQRASTTRIL